MVDSEWLIAGYFLSLLISWVHVFLNGRSKIWFVTFFVLKQRSNLRLSRAVGQERKLRTTLIFLLKVFVIREADSSETRSLPDCVTQAGLRAFSLANATH